MSTLAQQRRAVAAAQAILREHDPKLIVDGKAGKYTMSAYDSAPTDLRRAVDNVVASLGVAGGLKSAAQTYQAGKALADSGDNSAVFDLQIVPAVVREARRRGLEPKRFIAQLAIETGWGKSIPRLPDGRSTYNAAGIKAESIRALGKRSVGATTSEFEGGKLVKRTESFAVFDSADDFAKSYFWYLAESGSAYRYAKALRAKTDVDFAAAMGASGYATDPSYGRKLASVVSAVEKRYALV